MKLIEIAGHTDTGKQRTDNQDAFICERLWTDKMALLAVIDGVGGYAGGEKAAAIARQSIRNYMRTPKGDTLTMLREAVVFANNQIELERKKSNAFAEMCCVMTAVVMDAAEGKYYFVHVGDTRLYRYNEQGLQKITKDHSLVGVREDAGELSEIEAMNHPQRNIILRELGSVHHRIDDEDFLEYGKNDLLPGDTLLLCSDGLSDMVSSQQITDALQTTEPTDKKIRQLVNTANEMGGKDNITVVLAKNNVPAPDTTVRKKTPPVLADPVSLPVAALTVPAKTTSIQKNSMSVWLIIIFLATASFIWFTKNHDTAGAGNQAAANSGVVPADSTNNTHPNDTLQSMAPERAGTGVKPEPAIVPVRLQHSMSLTDMMKEHPENSQTLFEFNKPGRRTDSTALVITRADSSFFSNDTLTLRNKIFKDFKVGINLKTRVYLKLENVVFQNVRYPLYYDIKRDSLHPTILKF